MRPGLATARLLALFGAGWLLFNFPLLGLWDRAVTWFGLPLFPAAIFTVWLLLIGALAWVSERQARAGAPGEPPPR